LKPSQARFQCSNPKFISNENLIQSERRNFSTVEVDAATTAHHPSSRSKLSNHRRTSTKVFAAEIQIEISVKMALNDILKGMPSMDFGSNDYAMPQEFDFMNLHQNNRVLAVPPYSNVSLL
jgi:hypothetical protein